MRSRRVTFAIVLAILLALGGGCSKAGAKPPPRRFGDAMAEVGRRFERAGRAVAASRWDLANYDLGEIEEVFANDLPYAERPEDVPIDPAPRAAAFAATNLPALLKATEARDRAAFDAAFAAAAAACNACHVEAKKAFIEVPSTVGAEVPTLAASTTAQ
jgi:cytochrome c556